MIRHLLPLLLSLLTVTSANAQLPAEVSLALTRAGIPEKDASLWVQPLASSTPLWLHQPGASRNPASVMKLLTSLAALDLLGPAYTWETTAFADGPIRDGVLKGNLVLRGSGDPFLTWDRFAALLRELRERGVRRIDGDLLLDRTRFKQAPRDNASFDGRGARAYNAQPDALLLNFNAITLRLVPMADGSIRVTPTLPLAGLQVEQKLRATGGECVDWKSRLAPTIESSGGAIRVRLPGSYLLSCGEKLLNLAVPDSRAMFGAVFAALWREMGGEFSGQIRDGKAPTEAIPLAAIQSPPLADVLRETDKYSNNVMARQIFLTLAGDGEAASTERAIARVRAWMPGQGLDPAQWVLENGSGLSRTERSSAAELGHLLVAAWKSPRMPQFLAAQPVIGVDGTMKKRLADGAIAGRGYVKTGTLDGVKAAAGYLQDSRGRWLAFAWLINHPRATEAGDAALDALLSRLWAGN
ncbi:D-alanyl-D-alanine carboxypeptidase/D-alanyl-D-alanine-endopeptidase [Niveibacterium terrae]|uniref:D-alanyl-D-alanine carboxypeptidase/D-alanyl-D-alanine endopeptidase n=1 Tax=Niveibacterium terrae TaxID=3373598 RepID=UPI003A90612D